MTLDLGPAREVMAADGLDIVLVEMDGDVAHIALSVVDASCADCVLPPEMLEPILLDLLRPTHPTLAGVRIVDATATPDVR